MKKILHRLTGWLVKKTGYKLEQPITQIIVKPEELKRLHCQHFVDWHLWYSGEHCLEPDCFIREFKTQIVNKLMDEVIIKAEETDGGVLYSCDLLIKSV